MDAWAPALVAVPLVAALVLRPLPSSLDRRVGDGIAVLGAAAAAVIALVLLASSTRQTIVHWVAGWRPRDGSAIGIALVADPISAGISALAAAVGTAVLAAKFNRADTVDDRSHSLGLVFVAGLSGFALAGDTLTMFVFLELTSITAYALTGYHPESKGVLQGAIVFTVTNTVGALLFLTGAVVLYGATGTPNLAEIARLLTDEPVDGATAVAMGLMLTGLFVKGAVVPFHFWHADAHTVAPSWAAALFAAVLVQVPLYAVARLTWTAFAGPVGHDPAGVRAVLVVFAVATAVVGAVMCVLQDDLKRLLSFSTISHMGIALAGIAVLEPDGVAGAALYVLGHGLVKSALFLAAGAVVVRAGTASIAALSRRPARMPAVAGLLAVGGLGLVGAPPFGLFAGEELIAEASEAAGYPWLAEMAVVAAVLTGASVLRGAAALGLPRRVTRVPAGPQAAVPASGVGEVAEVRPPRTSRVLLVPAAALMGAAAVLGPIPTLVAGSEEAAERFVDTQHYVAAVLDGEAAAGSLPRPTDVLPPESLAQSGIAAAAAVLLALVGVRPPRWVRAPARTAATAARAVHSGHVGDYMVWLIAGTVALGLAVTTVLRQPDSAAAGASSPWPTSAVPVTPTTVHASMLPEGVLARTKDAEHGR